MDNKDTVGHFGIQAGLYTGIRSKSDTSEPCYTYKFDWLSIHNSNRHNRFKMGEGVKMIINTIGLTTYILGILANINNLLSVMLACVGVVWGIVKCLEKWEDYQAKKWERQQKEEEKKRKERLPRAS